jgi:hypothetical protein
VDELAQLRREAQRLGLTLSDDDLRAMLEPLERTKTALAAGRSQASDEIEPPYRFVPDDS